MKLPRISFGERRKTKFEPTLEEETLIANCTKFGIGHVEVDALIDGADLPSYRRESVEKVIRDTIMESVLKRGKERQA